MSDGTGDKIHGTLEEKKGEFKQAVGDATGNDRLKAEGHVDEAKGKVEQFIGDVKDKIEDIGDDIERRTN
ncbi:MAG: CsbD family protein [Thermomicrobiales bacterium]